MKLLLLLTWSISCSALRMAENEHRDGDPGTGSGTGLGAGLSLEETVALIESVGKMNVTAISEKLAVLSQLNEQEQKGSEDSGRIDDQILPFKNPTHVAELGDTVSEVNQHHNISSFMYQGDSLLTEKQIDILIRAGRSNRKKRQAYRDALYPTTTWGENVFYSFDASATGETQAIFWRGVGYWSGVTCINFIQDDTAPDRILVIKGSGCFSAIGKVGGVQILSIGQGCETLGTASHEVAHALGFFHAQSRFDRDNYITVLASNVKSGYLGDFNKQTPSTNFNYGLPYDYGSIMQYGGRSASANGRPTMVAEDLNYQDTMGSDLVSFYDVEMMNKHYGCQAKCPAATSAPCRNGGFPHPRDCRRCICPDGYGGFLCERRPPNTCGKELTATADFQTMKQSISTGMLLPFHAFIKCHYWIKAPEGQRVEVRIKTLSSLYLDGCIYGGIEIKTQKNQKETGYRFCSAADAGKILVSTSDTVPVIYFNRYNITAAELQYRIYSNSG